MTALVQITMNNLLRTYGAVSVYGSDIALSVYGMMIKVFQIAHSQIGTLFVSDSPLYLDCAQHIFRIHMMAFFLYGLHMTTASFFQGIGKPMRALLIPLAVLLSGRLGMDGALYAVPAADVLSFLLSGALAWMEFRSWRRLGRLPEG